MDNIKNKIKKFCETKDIKLIDTFPKLWQVYIKLMAAYALKHKKTVNEGFCDKIMKRYNLNDEGGKKIEPNSRDRAEYELKRMSVETTGARKGDILTGTHKGTSGSVMKVYNDVLPSSNFLDRMRSHPDIWEQFLIKLGSIPFFSQMTPLQRDIWLEVNEIKNDFFADTDRLQLIQPGVGDPIRKQGSIFASFLPDEDLSMLLINFHKK